jgi:hypothetical protein
MSLPVAPVFTPAADAGESYHAFSGSVSVTIASTNSSVIYYTDDGSDPRICGKKYSGAITVTTPTTLRAVGVSSTDIGPVSENDYVEQGQ